MLITISGKGGVGKSTLALLLTQELIRAGAATPMLLVDADPVSSLHLLLDLPEPKTLATVRDQLQRIRTPAEAPPLATLLADEGVLVPVNEHLHLLAMGQGEGPGCYCAVNVALGAVLMGEGAMPGLLAQYPVVVIDNEAGAEHLSRLRVRDVDAFVVVCLPTETSQVAADRLIETARKTGMRLKRMGLVVNRDNGRRGLAGTSLPLWASIPEDEQLGALERLRVSPTELPGNARARQAVARLAEVILTWPGQ